MFAEGDIPILLCAHIDTVFDNPPTMIFTDPEEEVIWAPQGLGADDRAGVYAIMDIIMSGFRPSVLFTTDEEIGCLGAKELVRKYPKCPFKNIKAIIQLDRRGYCDCVFYGCDNKHFTAWIESAGFVENEGSFTDISIICPKWGIAGVNLSVGYYLEHSNAEFLRLKELDKTLVKVKTLLKRIEDIDEPFIFIQREVYMDPFSWQNNIGKCAKCGKIIAYSDTFYCDSYNLDNTVLFCEKCVNQIRNH